MFWGGGFSEIVPVYSNANDNWASFVLSEDRAVERSLFCLLFECLYYLLFAAHKTRLSFIKHYV